MVALSSWLVILTLTLAGNQAVHSYTVEENFEYINKVLDALNVNTECQLPTYEEIDELQKSFRELEDTLGSSFEDKLSDDQKLVRKTLLDQWTSFQERMTSFVVIRSAKKRSFLGKVEAYQKGKYGFSICTQLKDARGPVTDRIFEKNPIVRYVKHLDNGDVPERSIEPEQTDVEKETEVIHTPIGESDSKVEQPETTETAEVVEETTITSIGEKEEQEAPVVSEEQQQEEEEENYDPLADIPVPSAQEKSETEVSTETNITPSTTEPQEEQDGHLEDIVTTTEAPELETEVVTEAAAAATEDTTTVVKIFDIGAEYVDDETDDEDLNRLDKVVPSEWNIDPIYGNFRWPDENPGDNDASIDSSIKTEWKKFLENPDLVETVEEEQSEEGGQQKQPEEEHQQQQHLEEQPVTEDPEYIPRRLSPKELRRKRKELLDKISGDRRSREQDQLHGYSHAPEREQPREEKKDRWANVADNNFAKISYNKDYISKTRPVKAMKSLFGGSSGGTRKKAMMSRA